MEPIICAETSVRIYHYLLHNNPEERSSHDIHHIMAHVTQQISGHEIWQQYEVDKKLQI